MHAKFKGQHLQLPQELWWVSCGVPDTDHAVQLDTSPTPSTCNLYSLASHENLVLLLCGGA
jgi:hypothetical protein